MENGERIEMKIDRVIEHVSDVRESQATLLERSVQLEKRFEGFANARDATCPMRTAIQRLGDKADGNITDVTKLKVRAENAEGCIDGLKTKVTFAKWTMRAIVGLAGLTGIVFGVLKVVGVF